MKKAMLTEKDSSAISKHVTKCSRGSTVLVIAEIGANKENDGSNDFIEYDCDRILHTPRRKLNKRIFWILYE